MKVLIQKCLLGAYETPNPYDSKCNLRKPCILCPKFVDVIVEVRR